MSTFSPVGDPDPFLSPVRTTTSIGQPSAQARSCWGAVGPAPFPRCTGGFQPRALSDVLIRAFAVGSCIGFFSRIRFEACFLFVSAMCFEWLRLTEASRQVVEQYARPTLLNMSVFAFSVMTTGFVHSVQVVSMRMTEA